MRLSKQVLYLAVAIALPCDRDCWRFLPLYPRGKMTMLPFYALPPDPRRHRGIVMAVQCPYCRHALSLGKAKPGRYTPACPECGRRFQLAVPEDWELEPTVRAIREDVPAVSREAPRSRRNRSSWTSILVRLVASGRRSGPAHGNSDVAGRLPS